MAQVIMMSKRFRKRPSEILNIDNDYLAFIFDETALYLEDKATDDKGNIYINKLKWTDKTQAAHTHGGTTNQAMMDFIKKTSKK